MEFSNWGTKILTESGITTLMRDLSCVGDESQFMLGGGSPARIPEMDAYFRKQMQIRMDETGSFENLVCNYAGPQGSVMFINALAELLQNNLGWNVTGKNIAITNGSQMAFTLLFKLLAGTYPDGTRKRILLPATPEYIGYSDTGENQPVFVSNRPIIEETGTNRFKYRVDFDLLDINEDIGALCVSRPTNPTANVLTDNEITRLATYAEAERIPFIIDGAYGLPFPGIIYRDVTPFWNDNTIVVLSLSKIGAPGTRTGIVVANEELIDALTCVNAVATLASCDFGTFVLHNSVSNGDILRLSKEVVRPYYESAASHATEVIDDYFRDIPHKLHEVEGAFFVWLWLPGLPITNLELYYRLKRRGVIVVPGNYFFPGLQGEWEHKHECLRLSYAQPRHKVEGGMKIIAEEVLRAYDELSRQVVNIN